MNIRPIQSEADYPGIVAVINAFESVPITVTQFSGWLLNNPPERIHYRRVAVNPANHITGYSVTVHETFAPAGHFYVWVGVAPQWHNQGIGSLLYDDAAAFLRDHAATRLKTEVRDDSPPALRFAEQRGFTIQHHLFESVLDLTTFDAAPYHALQTSLAAAGIRLCSVADFHDTPAARHKLYEVNRITSLDEPDADGTFMPFDEFEKWVCGSEWYRPEGQLIALDGDCWVGLAAVRLIPDQQEAYNLMTGVLRSHRGRQIAQGLKLAAIRYAQQHECRTIRTNNDSLNAPMLAINQKLGYQPQPGKFILVSR